MTAVNHGKTVSTPFQYLQKICNFATREPFNDPLKSDGEQTKAKSDRNVFSIACKTINPPYCDRKLAIKFGLLLANEKSTWQRIFDAANLIKNTLWIFCGNNKCVSIFVRQVEWIVQWLAVRNAVGAWNRMESCRRIKNFDFDIFEFCNNNTLLIRSQ